MSDYSLQAVPPITEPVNVGSISIAPVRSLGIFSLAFSTEDRELVSKQLENAYSLPLPLMAQSSQNSTKNVHCLALQREQVFLLFDDNDQDEHNIRQLMNQNVYITDQSDSWVGLKLSGADAREALARICPLDLHESVFTDGMVARTSMDHLSVIIMRDGEDFLLMSPTSSAQSFMHAVEQSATFVSPVSAP